jgi:uncharacterized protein YuzE
MAKTITPEIYESVFRAVPLLIDFPVSHFWVDYDHEADVLYISFQRPQKATDTEMTDEGILFRYHGKQLVGITVLDASTRSPESLSSGV